MATSWSSGGGSPGRPAPSGCSASAQAHGRSYGTVAPSSFGVAQAVVETVVVQPLQGGLCVQTAVLARQPPDPEELGRALVGQQPPQGDDVLSGDQSAGRRGELPVGVLKG